MVFYNSWTLLLLSTFSLCCISLLFTLFLFTAIHYAFSPHFLRRISYSILSCIFIHSFALYFLTLFYLFAFFNHFQKLQPKPILAAAYLPISTIYFLSLLFYLIFLYTIDSLHSYIFCTFSLYIFSFYSLLCHSNFSFHFSL